MAYHDSYTSARRTRDAVRDIRRSGTDDRDKKRALKSWFEAHPAAAVFPWEKHQAYDDLLGRERNRRLIG